MIQSEEYMIVQGWQGMNKSNKEQEQADSEEDSVHLETSGEDLAIKDSSHKVFNNMDH